MQYKNVGVIGAGTMGIGMAVDLVLHDMNCILVDVSEEVLNNARLEIIKIIRFAPLINNKLPKMEIDNALSKIKFTTEYDELSVSGYIVENTTEDWNVKKAVYKKLDSVCGPDINIAANTSCISVTKIGGSTKRADKIIGVHFMNPVYLKTSVEVIKGYHTSKECICNTKALLGQMGKDAIIVNDLPGFVTNRISHLYMNEAAFVVQDGVATPEQVDEIFKKCFGHKMGPLETADLIGLDTVVNSLDILYQSYQDPKFRCCPLLRKMVDANICGKKTGKGFYTY